MLGWSHIGKFSVLDMLILSPEQFPKKCRIFCKLLISCSEDGFKPRHLRRESTAGLPISVEPVVGYHVVPHVQ
jgi:hypothetical protein